ncbi:CHRD domain-containing protein [Geomonas sp. Red32]|uniref:CHRD domain-containing protein n=1 Tax=Geomonas sp. Red32 TaxID=2912856 RepID=UPI00202CEDE9|nr:CHRD domain-containing protein [Geomonas sp. Red32]MCM0080751.1 CHRD domain-containing protein [Geomonas sp. Red32]
MKMLQRLVLTGLLILSFTSSAAAADQVFRAELSGNSEVPAVKTPASGAVMLRVSDSVLSFELRVEDLAAPTAAFIHLGSRGDNGPPIAGLFGGPAKYTRFSGTLAGGEITDRNLLGDLQGKKVADLISLIRSGKTYVNVMTETFPAGEIRGQIEPSSGAPLAKGDLAQKER